MRRLHSLWTTLLLAFLLPATPALGTPPQLLRDDLSATSLLSAVGHSLDYLEKLPADRPMRLCNGIYTTGWLTETLRDFSDLVTRYGTGPELTKMVRQQFDICPAAGDDSLLITGYYEPEVAGSLTPTPTYRYPLYRVPPDLVIRGNRIGREEQGRMVPYWSREEIETQNRLKGLELVYLADPVDAFLLHVQGSGRVRLPDGAVRRVHFAAKNGHAYRSIGRILADQGKIPLAEVTMPRITEYLSAHPGEREQILHGNPSFIFFSWGESGLTPNGSLGEPLTAGRSVALDPACFPPGALGYLVSRKPRLDSEGDVAGWTEMRRFVLHQDSGSAIKGAGRLDLFWGGDRSAAIAAGVMKQPGTLFFLVKKQQGADNRQRGEL